MDMRNRILPVALAAALACGAMPGYAQSQADRTGAGGVAPAAGQEVGSLATTALVVGGVIAGAVGIAVAASGGDDESSGASVATITSTTTR